MLDRVFARQKLHSPCSVFIHTLTD
jgi:hypothetical protein